MTKHVPIDAAGLAEPADDRFISMLDAMDPNDAAFYACEANVVAKDATPAIMRELEQRYAFVGGTHAQYVAYFHRQDMPRMWIFRPVGEVRAYSGFSAVRKKTAGAQRKLLMAVAANFGWCDPRRRHALGLYGGGVFGATWVPSDHVDPSIFDLDNAFTRVATPSWVWPWAATPPLLSGDVWSLLSSAEQERYGRATPLAPMYTRLAMGMSHSVCILMAIVLFQTGKWLAASRRLGPHVHPMPMVLEWTDARRSMALWRRCLQAWRTQGIHARGIVIVTLNGGDLRTFASRWTSCADGTVLSAVLWWDWHPDDVDVAERVGLLTEAVQEGRVTQLHVGGPGVIRRRARCLWRPRRAIEAEAAEKENGLFISMLAAAEDTWWNGYRVSIFWRERAWTTLAGTDEYSEWRSRGGAARHTCSEGFVDLPGAGPAGLTELREGTLDDVLYELADSWLTEERRARRPAPGSSLELVPQQKPEVTDIGGLLLPGAVPEFKVMNEELERSRQLLLDGSTEAFYLHVDDGLCLKAQNGGADVGAGSEVMMNSIADFLETAGFVVPDRKAKTDPIAALGFAIERYPARVRLPERKLALLDEALGVLERAYAVDVDVVGTVLGIWTWAATVRRELLSVLCHIYKFVQENRHRTLPLWPSVRREIKMMRSLLPLAELNLGARPPPLLFATDAMGATGEDCGGFGIVGTPIAEDEIRDVFMRARQLAYSVPRVDGVLSGLKRPERVLTRTVPSTVLPPTLFDRDRWRTVDKGRWRDADHITLGEGRAVIRLLRRLAAAPEWHGRLVMSLEDNQPICGALTKGRSPALHILRLCRQKAAVCLAASIRLVLPWVETLLQPADFDSRDV